MTSHDVVARTRKILRVRRVGHTGTLDPFATGVLVLLVGRATRLARFVSGADKDYEAVVRLGFATTTGDIEGSRVSTDAEVRTAWSDDEILAAVQQLRGEIEQVPPMFSAKKQQGKKLYQFARRGEEVERAPITVTIHAFEALTHNDQLIKDNHDGTVDLRVSVKCSAGTYVRTLAEDLGKLLGSSAHLAELRRTRAGDFRLEDAVTLEQLNEVAAEGAIGTVLLPPGSALSAMASLHLTSAEALKAINGVALSVSVAEWADGEHVRLIDENGELVGVAIFDQTNQILRPRVILSGGS